ncbi:MAG: type II toxin-antitoxin system RelE/ParE family toxin [Pseudomonadota bacterium]
MAGEKELRWIGSSYEDLLALPDEVRRDAGFQLSRIQAGQEAENWKPFDTIGGGVREIRLRESSGIYRIMYVAKFKEAVYVLHCFQKKTQATGKVDIDVAAARYRAVINLRRMGNEN